jgi:predicted amidohydrolase
LKSDKYDNWKSLAIDTRDNCLTRFCEVAKELSIGIIITSFSKGILKPRNSAFFINRSGKIIMKYDKVHTCDFANEALLENGLDFNMCEFDGIKIGIMICYDREYPESARCLMLKGAEIILVPNDCGSMEPRLRTLSTRAYENMVGVAMANPPGINAGYSCAYSPITWDDKGIPIDNTIAISDSTTEGILYANFNIDQIRKYRKKEMMGNTFRKVSSYEKLLNSKIEEPFIRKKNTR